MKELTDFLFAEVRSAVESTFYFLHGTQYQALFQLNYVMYHDDTRVGIQFLFYRSLFIVL
jgi:hypothetical protein